jgi:hypothetical protein
MGTKAKLVIPPLSEEQLGRLTIAADAIRANFNFRPTPQMLELQARFSEHFAFVQKVTAEFVERWEAVAAQVTLAFPKWELDPELLLRLQEEVRFERATNELALVPHGVLWHYVDDLERRAGADADRAEELVRDIWPDLRMHLDLPHSRCLEDRKLHQQFSQMIRAHDEGLFELTVNSIAPTIERAVRLSRVDGEHTRAFEWLKEDAATMPLDHFHAFRGVRIWLHLIKNAFVQCHTDVEADALRFPNRHASAHGVGSKPSTSLSSLNAILLVHFVINLVDARGKYRLEQNG